MIEHVLIVATALLPLVGMALGGSDFGRDFDTEIEGELW